MPSLFVIGVVSLDVLHFGEQTVHTVGGAGLYTALAARQAGATSTLLAPRPHPLPAHLAPIPERLRWIGPVIAPDEMTKLEIAHHGGGRATLLHADWGAEKRLMTDDLPEDLSGFDFIHVAALSSAERQLAFLRACRERGARRISVGTYAKLVYGDTDNVRTLLQSADVFFMNENEANGLFGSVENARAEAGKLLLVTLAERGAVVLTAEEAMPAHAPHSGERGPLRGSPAQATLVPAPVVREVDPTGAGDTFCGATLAGLAQGADPVAAARRGVALASAMIEHLGPAGLLL